FQSQERLFSKSPSNSSIVCSSTPAVPRFALTRLYASHTSRFVIPNGFALSTQVLPLQVAREIKLNNAAPSVQFHYRTFDPTTSDSAPVPRIGTLALVDAVHLSFSLYIGATGSYVPYHSLIRTHATFMPDADWAINRSLPSLIPVPELLAPVSTSSHFLTARHQWFTFVRLSESHLTDFSPPFPTTLTTGTLDPRRLWRFEACSCKPTSRDLPSSLVKNQSRTSCDDFGRNTQPARRLQTVTVVRAERTNE